MRFGGTLGPEGGLSIKIPAWGGEDPGIWVVQKSRSWIVGTWGFRGDTGTWGSEHPCPGMKWNIGIEGSEHPTPGLGGTLEFAGTLGFEGTLDQESPSFEIPAWGGDSGIWVVQTRKSWTGGTVGFRRDIGSGGSEHPNPGLGEYWDLELSQYPSPGLKDIRIWGGSEHPSAGSGDIRT